MMNHRVLIRERVHRAVEDMPEQREVPAKAAYLQATRQVPELVATESDPVLFWRSCFGNIRTAAKQLVAYWNHRLQLFGPERAYLPLTDLSGLSGALSGSDIDLLKSGLVALAPDDLEGRRVLIMDPTRVKKVKELVSSSREENDNQETNVKEALGNEDVLSHIRCLVFCCHLAAAAGENPESSGLVIVKVGHNIMSPTEKVKYLLLSDLLEYALPTPLSALHIVILPTGKGAPRVLEDKIVPLVDHGLPDYLRPLTTVTSVSHQESQHGGAFTQLAPFGFAREGLPVSLGGTWSYSNFETRLQNHTQDMAPKTALSPKPANTARNLRESGDFSLVKINGAVAGTWGSVPAAMSMRPFDQDSETMNRKGKRMLQKKGVQEQKHQRIEAKIPQSQLKGTDYLSLGLRGFDHDKKPGAKEKPVEAVGKKRLEEPKPPIAAVTTSFASTKADTGVSEKHHDASPTSFPGTNFLLRNVRRVWQDHQRRHLNQELASLDKLVTILNHYRCLGSGAEQSGLETAASHPILERRSGWSEQALPRNGGNSTKISVVQTLILGIQQQQHHEQIQPAGSPDHIFLNALANAEKELPPSDQPLLQLQYLLEVLLDGCDPEQSHKK